jgi:hypothetical protein
VTVAVTPQIVYNGIAPWVDVASASSIGEARTQVGPVADVSQMSAIAGRVKALVTHAENDFARAMIEHPELCARCVRTLLRAAVGDLEATLTATAPSSADAARMQAAVEIIGPHVVKIQNALKTLCVEASTGAVVAPEVVSGLLDHYRKSGAPMHVGAASRWSDYKLCECAPPGTPQEAAMMVGGVEVDPVAAVAAVSAPGHHTGCGGKNCGCGCGG